MGGFWSLTRVDRPYLYSMRQTPRSRCGAKLRQEYGLVVGHIGLVVVQDGEVVLIHAASSDLEGSYQGGTVVQVPLADYLARVDKFAGVMVTRF